MPEDKKWEIADAADMIVSGFAFKRCGETIQIVNLNKNEPHVMILWWKFLIALIWKKWRVFWNRTGSPGCLLKRNASRSIRAIPKMVLRIKFITFISGSQVTMMKYIFAIT